MRTGPIFCFKCEEIKQTALPVGRRDECPSCHSDLHVCKNCQNYDPKSYNECREPVAEGIQEKDRSNFCDYFSAKESGEKTADKRDQLLSAAEALFKKS